MGYNFCSVKYLLSSMRGVWTSNIILHTVAIPRYRKPLKPLNWSNWLLLLLLSSCRNFGLWLLEFCSEVLNHETMSATNLAYSHYLLVSQLALPQLEQSFSFFTLLLHSAIIKFRGPWYCNRAHNLVIGAPKPHTVPGPRILHFNHGNMYIYKSFTYLLTYLHLAGKWGQAVVADR